MTLERLEVLSEDQIVLHFLEGGTLCCGPGEILDFSLRPGRSLEGEDWEKLQDACAFRAVRRQAAELISRRAMSAGELRRKLREKGADPLHAEKAAERLTELGAIDEGAYAAMVVRHYAAKGYGRKRLEEELYRRELPRETWEEALAALPDSREVLDALVQKRLRSAPMDRKGLKKLADSLLRRGYGWEEVRAAIARNTAQEDNDFDD